MICFVKTKNCKSFYQGLGLYSIWKVFWRSVFGDCIKDCSMLCIHVVNMKQLRKIVKREGNQKLFDNSKIKVKSSFGGTLRFYILFLDFFFSNITAWANTCIYEGETFSLELLELFVFRICPLTRSPPKTEGLIFIFAFLLKKIFILFFQICFICVLDCYKNNNHKM